ncbi:MAG TPA: hypothetical protein VJA94_16375 [Candidatus Angelobacter sp.]
MFPTRLRSGLLFLVAAVVSTGADAQHSSPPDPALPSDPNQFVREMIQHEMDAESKDHTLWRYRLHKEDEVAAQDRDVIETKEGSLARTLLINGKPLTPEQRSKDEERMKKLVDDPNERAKREHRAKQDEQKAKELLRAIPDAFIFRYDGMDGELTRLAFTPNPRYSPATRELMVYHAMTGKLWVDRSASRLAMIEGHLTEDVKFGWGLLGHLDKGGTFKVVQKNVGDNHWDTIFLDVNMQGRAIIFKTINVREKQVFTDFRRVADDMTIARAYEMLQQHDSAIAASNLSGK